MFRLVYCKMALFYIYTVARILKNSCSVGKLLGRIAEDNYQVDCDNEDYSWSEACGGKWDFVKLISQCLEEGGCATNKTSLFECS